MTSEFIENQRLIQRQIYARLGVTECVVHGVSVFEWELLKAMVARRMAADG